MGHSDTAMPRLLVNKLFALPRSKGDEGTLVALPNEALKPALPAVGGGYLTILNW